MFEHRKSPRYQTLAKARIKGVSEGETLLKDISVTGCCVECTIYAEIKPNVRYLVEVIPESAARIEMFELLAESMWIRPGNYSHEIGFFIIESPKKKQFLNYVDYLSWRYSQGNSMTGGSIPGTSDDTKSPAP